VVVVIVRRCRGVPIGRRHCHRHAASIVFVSAMGVLYLFDPTVNLLSFVFSAGIGVLFGYFPARRAAQMNPIEALRHERMLRTEGLTLHAGSLCFRLGFPALGYACDRPRPSYNPESAEVADVIGQAHAFRTLCADDWHAAAALYRHYMVRDNTLRRMLPSAE
jgi:hypothetical protein